MVRVVLRWTSNVRYQYLIGTVGELDIRGEKFFFKYLNKSYDSEVLYSSVKGIWGDLYHPASREVSIQTTHSLYRFDKLENVGERLYDGVH